MKKDMMNLWEQEGDLERMKIFFNRPETDEEQKERIKQLALQKMEQYDKDPIKHIEEPIVNEKRNPFFKVFQPLRSFRFHRKWGAALTAVLLLFVIFVGKIGMDGTDGALNFALDTKGIKQSDQLQNPVAGDRGANESSEIYNSASLQEYSKSAPDSDSSIAVNPDLPQPQSAIPPAKETLPRKITYNIFASIKVEDVNLAIQEISGKLENFKGYIVDSSVNDYENGSSGHITLKIPSERLNDFKGELPQVGKVINQNMSANDITNQYYDTDARLRSYQAQEERYLALLQEAKSVEDILNIEIHLNDIRVQIEQLQGQLKLWDHEVAYSTVQIDLQTTIHAINVENLWQPVSWSKTWLAAKDAVLKTISSAWNALNYLVVGIAYALPVIILLGVVVAVYWSIKKYPK